MIQASLVRAPLWMLAGYMYSASAQHVITQARLLRLKFDGGATVTRMLMNYIAFRKANLILLPSPSCPAQDVWRKRLLGPLRARLIGCLSV